MTDTNLQTALLLRRAALQIAKYGWIRYQSQDHTGACCISGAICQARDELNVSISTFRRAEMLTYEALPLPGYSIVYWNDNKAQNKEQVLQVLDRAAERAEAWTG